MNKSNSSFGKLKVLLQ